MVILIANKCLWEIGSWYAIWGDFFVICTCVGMYIYNSEMEILDFS